MNRYKGYINYIKDNLKFVYIIITLYFASAVLGYFFPSIFQDYINKFILEVLDKTREMNAIEIFIFIFQNNLKTAFFGMIFGVILGIFPILLTFFNGYVIGYISKLIITQNRVLDLWRLLPHGIFELIAVFLSFAFGLKIGYLLFTIKKKKGWKKKWTKEFLIILEIFIYVILPLLLIAALIEAGFMFLIN
jgi:stage II sporulation protein M